MGTHRHRGAYDEVRAKDPALKLVMGGSKPNTYNNPFADIDFTSDDDIPSIRMVKLLIGKVSNIQKPFNNVSSVVINWQTDIAYGFVTDTYADLLDNFLPKPIIYIVDPDTANGYKKADYDIYVVTSADQSQILTVTFDFAVNQTGFIRF